MKYLIEIVGLHRDLTTTELEDIKEDIEDGLSFGQVKVKITKIDEGETNGE